MTAAGRNAGLLEACNKGVVRGPDGARQYSSSRSPVAVLHRVRGRRFEIRFQPEILKTIPLERFVSNDSMFNFHTFFCVVHDEFVPILSDEHQAWGWFTLTAPPKPLHKALDLSLRNKIIQTKIQSIIDIIDSL